MAAVGGQVEVHLERVAADVRDLGVAEGQQVLGGELAEFDVVEAEGAHAGKRSADPDDRLAEIEETLHLVRGQLERDGDHRIHALAQQELLEHQPSLVRAAAEVVEGEVVAPLEEGGFGAFDDGAVEPPVEEGDHDPHVAGAAGGEAGGARGDHVAELGGGGDDALAGGGRDGAAAGRARETVAAETPASWATSWIPGTRPPALAVTLESLSTAAAGPTDGCPQALSGPCILVRRVRLVLTRVGRALGELPKRPKGSDCKSDCYAFGGSNPSLATMKPSAPAGAFRRSRGRHPCWERHEF